MGLAADWNHGLVKEGHPESNLLKSTFCLTKGST